MLSREQPISKIARLGDRKNRETNQTVADPLENYGSVTLRLTLVSYESCTKTKLFSKNFNWLEAI